MLAKLLFCDGGDFERSLRRRQGAALALLAVGLFLPFTGPAANLAWLFAGAALQKLFANHRKAVDIGCAAALALCAVSLVLPH